jgi:GT2 family glycosyltransferase
MAQVLDASLEKTSKMIPVLGFPTYARHDLAQRMIDSIDYPVEHLVIVDNSGRREFQPVKPEIVKNLWLIQVPFGMGPTAAMNLVIKTTPHASYWILASEDTYCEPGSLEKIHKEVDTEALNFVDAQPDWCFVAIGEGVVLKAGLGSELFHPLYFEDNDYERQIDALGIPKKRIQARINHDNSSTIASGFGEKNQKTFAINHRLFEKRTAENNMNSGEWSLKIRRENSWD